MSPFDEVLLQTIDTIYRRTGGPVRTVALSTRLGIARRSVQRRCRQLENIGHLARPDGPKSGYTLRSAAA